MPRLGSNLQTTNYDDPHGPGFSGQFAPAIPPRPDVLTVVTYNINFALEIDQAIEEFRTLAPLPSAGIVLLQEMDEEGSERLARAVGYNYIYFPASIARTGRDFGNAILSPYPLTAPRKLILPGRHPVNGQQRIAVLAVVDLGGLEVLACSVHSETYTVPVAYRRAQVDALVADIGRAAGSIVVGGDFNTVTARGIRRLTQQFAAAGLGRSSAGAGRTIVKLGFQPSAADHIFSRGLARLARGRLEMARASDHFPVWVHLALP